MTSMVTMNSEATLAAAIGVAAWRVEIIKNERNRHLHWVNEKERELSDLEAKLDAAEEELRLEQFILDTLIAGETKMGEA